MRNHQQYATGNVRRLSGSYSKSSVKFSLINGTKNENREEKGLISPLFF